MDKGRLTKESLCRRLGWSDLDEDYIRQLIGLAKIEDLAGGGLAAAPGRLGDVTSALFANAAQGRAELVARESLTVSGLGLLAWVLEAYQAEGQVECFVEDGETVASGAVLARIEGDAAALLQAERVLLNFLQRLSGIATETRAYQDLVEGTGIVLLDTRKTTPGYRALEKYAVACGGACNHRLGLFDRYMLKDNHLAVAGAADGEGLAGVVRRAVAVAGDLPVEVEVDRLEQIPAVLEAGADIILLDNFNLAETEEALGLIGDRAYTEASGGIDREKLMRLAALGLDFVSTGALVHRSRWRDIGMDWQTGKGVA